jgi:hypothetical protein
MRIGSSYSPRGSRLAERSRVRGDVRGVILVDKLVGARAPRKRDPSGEGVGFGASQRRDLPLDKES